MFIATENTRTYLVDTPFWCIYSIDVPFLFDGYSGVASVVERGTAVDHLSRSVEPIRGINLECTEVSSLAERSLEAS